MTEIPDCAISYFASLDTGGIDSFIEELEASGVVVERDVHEHQIYAALEWMIPTAVTLFIADKYFGTLIQEAAKSHYPAIRSAVGKLVSRVLRRADASVVLVASPPTKIAATTSHPISIYSKLRNGRAVKFIFPAGADASVALATMFELLQRNHASFDADETNRQIEKAVSRSRQQVIFFFDSGSSKWVLVHPSVTNGV